MTCITIYWFTVLVWLLDNSGKIRIWDTTQAEHILKYEYQPISGVIKDIVWSPDSKRIAVCGEGREKCVPVKQITTFLCCSIF